MLSSCLRALFYAAARMLQSHSGPRIHLHVRSPTPHLQGATCYLNSLLQTLFHVPLFRRAVYHMPTEEGEEPEASICVALKYLFFRLQYAPSPVSTKQLIQSFGWQTAEAFQQHDVQELELILYDKLEEKMKGARCISLCSMALGCAAQSGPELAVLRCSDSC
jgi:hypothetical protein